MKDKIEGLRPNLQIINVEPASCPTLTRGYYSYDYGDVAGHTPLMKIYTLVHGFIPPPVHAGGLSYHGMAPIICHLLKLGLVEARAEHQLGTFRDYHIYLLNTIEGICEEFIIKFIERYKKEVRDISFKNMRYLETYLKEFFWDMIGYAATVMIRRMYGLAHNIDVDGIEDLKRRSEVQISVLELATSLMMSRYKFTSIRDVTLYVKSIIF